jgi:hypothetical protein
MFLEGIGCEDVNWILLAQDKSYTPLMKSEGSQEAASGAHPEPVDSFTPPFCKIYFNIVLQSKASSSKWSDI